MFGQRVADAVGLGDVLGLARRGARGDLCLDLGRAGAAASARLEPRFGVLLHEAKPFTHFKQKPLVFRSPDLPIFTVVT